MTLLSLLGDKKFRQGLKPAIHNVAVSVPWLLATSRPEIAEWIQDTLQKAPRSIAFADPMLAQTPWHWRFPVEVSVTSRLSRYLKGTSPLFSVQSLHLLSHGANPGQQKEVKEKSPPNLDHTHSVPETTTMAEEMLFRL